tara:strand:+ start:2223 stop:2951 length:729 start_codon:yes stop_codon:yes gene_type:complete
MNKNLLQIYKIYNIESFYYLQKIKNNLNTIFKNLIKLKYNIRSYKYVYIIENDLILDISDHIIYKLIKNHNFNIINNQQDNKYINLIQIQTLKYEYYFKNNINFHSPLYLKIIDQININNNFHFLFILHPYNNTPIGIRKNSDLENTLFQFNFFGKKLEHCINNTLTIVLHNHEKDALFLNTNYTTFPTIYFVYEARNHILTNITNISNDRYLEEMVKYVRNKGYVVNIHRQNNQFVMGLVH